MAQPQASTGIPLGEFRKDCPPGWGPGHAEYPLKLFFQKLRLWYRTYEGPDECVGPLVAGRLPGQAQRLALELKLIRPDGTYDQGDDALVRLSTDEVRDPMDPTIILQHGIPSGVQALCDSLRDCFGHTDEEQTTRALDAFFEYRKQSNQTLAEFNTEWNLRLEDARNRVACSYLWLKQSTLSQRYMEDLRLQVQGDLGRFDELRTLALRLSHRHDQHVSKGDIFYETENDEGENSWPSEAYAFYDDDWGAEPFWSWSEDDYYYYGDYDYEENELYEGFDYTTSTTPPRSPRRRTRATRRTWRRPRRTTRAKARRASLLEPWE